MRGLPQVGTCIVFCCRSQSTWGDRVRRARPQSGLPSTGPGLCWPRCHPAPMRSSTPIPPQHRRPCTKSGRRVERRPRRTGSLCMSHSTGATAGGMRIAPMQGRRQKKSIPPCWNARRSKVCRGRAAPTPQGPRDGEAPRPQRGGSGQRWRRPEPTAPGTARSTGSRRAASRARRSACAGSLYP